LPAKAASLVLQEHQLSPCPGEACGWGYGSQPNPGSQAFSYTARHFGCPTAALLELRSLSPTTWAFHLRLAWVVRLPSPSEASKRTRTRSRPCESSGDRSVRSWAAVTPVCTAAASEFMVCPSPPLICAAETSPTSRLGATPALGLSLFRFMVHYVSEARRPPRWRVDSALACSPARVPGDHRCARGRGAAPRLLL
jgi:hypothetical protein